MQEISRAALATVLAPQDLNRVLTELNGQETKRIPNWEKLGPGDVILSSERGNYKHNIVYRFQRRFRKFEEEAAKWTHAMVYLGGLHVAESNSGAKDLVTGKFTVEGTNMLALTRYSANHELMVCRPKGFTPEARAEAARYAAIDIAERRRTYDRGRLLEMAVRAGTPRVAVAAHSVICTDFAMEIIAIGGGQLLKEYNAGEFSFPAQFATSEQFECEPVDYFKLV